MAYDGNGNFNRLYNWQDDAANGIYIMADRMDAEMDGFANGLSVAFLRDGQTSMQGDLDVGNNHIIRVADPTSQTDGVNKRYVDDNFLSTSGTPTIESASPHLFYIETDQIADLNQWSAGVTGTSYTIMPRQSDGSVGSGFGNFVIQRDSQGVTDARLNGGANYDNDTAPNTNSVMTRGRVEKLIETQGGEDYVNKSGDTMTGDLLFNSWGVVGNEGATTGITITAGADGNTGTSLRLYGDSHASAAKIAAVRQGTTTIAAFYNGDSTTSSGNEVITRTKGDTRYVRADGYSTNIQPLTFANKEPSDLSTDGQISFDSSRGIIVYRDQQIGDANGDGAYTVLDSSNIEGGSNIWVGGIDTDEGGATPITFNLTNTVSISGNFTANGSIKSNNAITADDDNGGFTIGNGGTNCYLDAKGGTDLQFRFDGTTEATMWSNGNLDLYSTLKFTRSGIAYIDYDGSNDINVRSGGTKRYTFESAGNLSDGTSIVTRSNGDDRYARADSSAGSVGTYAFARGAEGTTTSFNGTRSAAYLTPSDARGQTGGSISSGTWRCMGYQGDGSNNGEGDRVTLWLRIS